jgi:hypothetical protein
MGMDFQLLDSELCSAHTSRPSGFAYAWGEAHEAFCAKYERVESVAMLQGRFGDLEEEERLSLEEGLRQKDLVEGLHLDR